MALPRISGRLGSELDLNVSFYKDGALTDPHAIRKIEIYKSAVQDENLVAEFSMLEPSDEDYPSPLTKSSTGKFHLYWDVPETGIVVPDIFFDVWYYITDGPEEGSSGSTGSSGSESTIDYDDESLWVSCCNKFWLYDSGFYCDDELENVRFGFEAMDAKFNQPEVRTLEVGLMPMPLYDYDYNKIAPMIPRLSAYFSLWTDNNELLVNNSAMSIGLRQGTYRSNPFVLKYKFDSRRVLKGSYRYRVTICLPNGESRTSPTFYLQVA